MLSLMHRLRSAALALLAVSVALVVACQGKQQNGQECLKDGDCENAQCIAHVCTDPNAGRPPFDGAVTASETSVSDSGAETATADAAGETSSTDSEAADTGTPPSDTGAAD
jgi:hypothetical protein